MRAAAPAPIERRGVYWAPYTKNGCPVLYAVKRDGERLSPILVLLPGIDPDVATEWLWRRLDRDDPDPRQALKLLRNTPRPEERPAPVPAMVFAKNHPLMDGVTWERIQRDEQLRARVLKQLRAWDATRRQA